MKFLLVRVRFNWGFAARFQPQSKMRMAFKYPPPTTLLGALAYPLIRLRSGRVELVAKGKKLTSATEQFKKYFEEVAVSMQDEPSVYGSYLRVNRIYRGSVDFGVTALPSSFLYSNGEATADLVYVMKEVPEGLERAAWGISRIGSRESVVSVDSVYVGDASLKRGESAKTRFSFYLKDYKVRGNGTVLYVVDWREQEIGNYAKAERVPYYYPKGEVEVSGELSWFELNLPWGKEVVLH